MHVTTQETSLVTIPDYVSQPVQGLMHLLVSLDSVVTSLATIPDCVLLQVPEQITLHV
jgi:hypothetical protein